MDSRDREIEQLRKDNQALRETILSLRSAIEAQTAAFEDQKQALEKTLEQLSSLQRRFFGPKSEKMPMPEVALRKKRGGDRDIEAEQAKRKANREKRLKTQTERIEHKVKEEKRTCPHCGRTELKPMGEGRITKLWEYVPGYFVCQEHVQETLACLCGDYVATADTPLKPFEGGQYGPHFIAHVIASKCLDSIPIHRLEKRFSRLGIVMSRSTMTDLFHRAAQMLAPISRQLLDQVAQAPVVQADETSVKVQRREKRGFLWTFLAEKIIAYCFSPDRSGQTPQRVLGGTEGVLVVDGYTGYNRVTDVKGRTRAGCLAHARRKLFESLEMAPEAQEGLELILKIYEVEHEAHAQNISGTPQHLDLRRQRAGPVMKELHQWLTEQKELHPPKSPMGKAVSYALKSWVPLSVFLCDPRVPVDNNRSESALRVAALGRKNWLFVGHDQAGENLAGLYSLVATCVANDVNPELYLADVLLRVHTTPQSQLDTLLPQNWALAA